MRKLACLALLLAACGDATAEDADTRPADADANEVADTSPDISSDTDDDTSAPDSANPSDTDTGGDTAPPSDTSPVDADDVALDADDAADTAADTTDPNACSRDEDCLALFIVPPNACIAPRCIDQTCQLGPRDCADADPCTLDACDPRTGCVNTTITADLAGSRFFLCPAALPEADARTACADRGAELATIDTEADANAVAALLADFAVDSAHILGASPYTCPAKRVVLPPCKALPQDACPIDESCATELPFICEIACNDGDPCTRDFVGEDGLCHTDDGSCDDGNACTIDACDPRSGCVHTVPATTCEDNNPCTTDTCAPATGACTHTVVRRPWSATRDLLECPGPLNWTAARQRCAVNGAILAMPTTPADMTLLANLATSLRATTELWVPLKQRDGGNQPWDWVDQGGSGAPPWCPDVAPNFSEAGYCAHWDTTRACLTNSPCDVTRSFGCLIDITIP